MSLYRTLILPLYTGSIEDIIQYLKSKNILQSTMNCLFCTHSMTQTKCNKKKDKYVWKCQDKTCPRYKTTRSIRDGSFIENFRLDLKTIILLLFRFFKEECNIGKTSLELDISTPTIISFFASLRIKISAYLVYNPIQLGGPSVICQIDESLFCHKVKYHRGRAPSEQIWVFGIVDTSFTPSRGYLSVVPNRSEENLYPIIESVVLPGTIIWSDSWAAYRNISSRLRFEHGMVNHSLNFVDSQTGIHTQNIESYWNKQKMRIKKMMGIQKDKLQLYLNEWMWRDHFLQKNWDNFMRFLSINK